MNDQYERHDSTGRNDGYTRAPTRRRFLSIAGTGVFGLTTGVGVSAGADLTEIVLTRNRTGPVDTSAVPTRWYQHTITAKRAASALRERLRDEPGVASVGLAAGDGSIRGLRRKVIEVLLTNEATSDVVPERIDGITIRTRTTDAPRYRCFSGSYDPLRGGITLENGDGDVGSVCCRVYDGGSPYLLSVRHLFTDTSEPCSSVSDAYAYRNGDAIGVFQDGIQKHDAMWFDLLSGYSISDDIVNESAVVEGWVTEYGLDKFSSDDTTLYMRGSATCNETYTVRSYDNTATLSCDPDHVDIVHYDGGGAKNGDSGGPVYFVNDNGNAFLSSILSGERTISCGFFCTTDVAFGSGAYAMRDAEGLDFD